MLEFRSDDGQIVPAVTSDQMREIDRIAIEETGPNLFQMMENAGRNLAALIIELLGPSWRQERVVILAGSGGNGGGGICVARHLVNHGGNVVLVVSDVASLSGVPQAQYATYRNAAGEIAGRADSLMPDLIVDALIGYGLRSAPRGRLADLIRWTSGTGAPILSLDIPSGVDGTTGEIPGVAVVPDWTMTLALPKTGLQPRRTGQLFLGDLGIPVGTYHRARIEYVSPFHGRHVIALHGIES